jgi:tetratricopeptide (TPR) repeat protein
MYTMNHLPVLSDRFTVPRNFPGLSAYTLAIIMLVVQHCFSCEIRAQSQKVDKAQLKAFFRTYDRISTYVQRKQLDKALSAVRVALLKYPQNPQCDLLSVWRLLVLWEKDLKDSAMHLADSILQIRPQSVPIQAVRLGLVLEFERYDEALVQIDNAIMANVDFGLFHGLFYALKGEVLLKTKHYGESIESLTTAIELDGDKNGKNHIVRAMVYEELGLKDLACRDFQEGLSRGAHVPPDSKLELLCR